MAKKVLKITGIILGVLIILAFALPFFFKDKIVALVKSEVNNTLNAKVDFSDASLSFFRHFPRVSLSLENLYIAGTENFAKDTLLQAKEIDVAVNLWSVISGETIKIHSVTLESPSIHAIVNKEGLANWDIVKPDSSATETSSDTASAFHVALQKYSISNGTIRYDDVPGNMYASIVNLNHSGSGDFTQDIFTLSTKTAADAVNFSYEGVPYLNSTRTTINADFEIDNKQSLYKFNTEEVKLNDMQLNTKGSFQLLNDSTYRMDINFKTPENSFKSLLSLIPAIYAKEFDKIKTSGTAAFEGMVKGDYSPQQLPAFKVQLNVKDGFFQYPDLPKPVKNIQIDALVENPDGVPDHTAINISKGHIEMENEPFDFKLIFKNPETIKYIDAVAKGKLDLSKLTQLVKLEEGTRLGGIVNADVYAKGNMSALETQRGPFTAGGFLDIAGLLFASKDIPQPIQNGNMRINIVNTGGVADQTSIDIPSGHIEFGKDPLDFSLKLQKPMSDIVFDGTAKGRFNLESVKQLVTLEPGTAISGIIDGDLRFKGSNKLIEEKKYDQIGIAGVVKVNNLVYTDKDYPDGVKLNNTMATMNNDLITLNSLEGVFKKINFSANGQLQNAIGYAMSDEALTGKLNVKAGKVNLNDLMGTDTATAAATTESAAGSAPFLVPGKINFALNADVDQVQYDKVVYKNVRGNLLLKDETVTLQNLQTEALDGSIAFNGTYSTKLNKTQPDMNLTYSIKDIDIQKAFLSFNTVQKLMPIAQFLGGKLSSDLKLSGKLGGDMMPMLSSLTGNGNLLLLEGVLQKFQPLEKLATALNIGELKTISVKDIKNYIEFANGRVLVKPFTVKVKDIEMEIGGTHGIDQTLDYVINMKVPRAKLGSQGNALVNNLVTQANNKGIPVAVSDMVNLHVGMKGSMTNPSIQYNLKEALGDGANQFKDQAKAFVQSKVDSAKTALKDTAQAIKKELIQNAKNELLKKIPGAPKDTKDTTEAKSTTPVKKAEETIKGIKDLFKKKS